MVYLPLCLAIIAFYALAFGAMLHADVAVFGLLLVCVVALRMAIGRFAMVLCFSGLGWIERKPFFLKYTHTHPRIYIGEKDRVIVVQWAVVI